MALRLRLIELTMPLIVLPGKEIWGKSGGNLGTDHDINRGLSLHSRKAQQVSTHKNGRLPRSPVFVSNPGTVISRSQVKAKRPLTLQFKLRVISRKSSRLSGLSDHVF
jgi:hypothetical protein